MHSPNDPAKQCILVVPSDTVDLPLANGRHCRGLYCSAAGNVAILDGYANASTLPMNAGQILPLYVARVKATLTTATVYALY